MRILSKFKDYYDFPSFGYDTNDQVTYVRDFKVVQRKFDHRIDEMVKKNYPDHWYSKSPAIHEKDIHYLKGQHTEAHGNRAFLSIVPRYRNSLHMRYLFICDTCYPVWMADVARRWEQYEHQGMIFEKPVYVPTSYNAYEHTIAREAAKGKRIFEQRTAFIDAPAINTEFDCPVMLLDDNLSETILNPSLMMLGFDSLAIHDIYQEIEMFIGRKKDVVEDTLDNPSKIVAKGFDKKVSFRKRMPNEL